MTMVEFAKLPHHLVNANQCKVLFSDEQIQQRVKELGSEITKFYQRGIGVDLVVLGVLNGAFRFVSDLTKYIDLNYQIDFVQLSSYGNNESSSGEVKLIKSPSIDLNNKDVLICDDIIDTGLSLEWLKEYLYRVYPYIHSIQICVLLDKKDKRSKRPTHLLTRFIGFEIENDPFCFGYGLDLAGYARHLCGIYYKV